MRPIPNKMREDLAELPRMQTCTVKHFGFGFCEGRIQWHHVWKYAGTQINEMWAILGACERHHRLVDSEWLVRDAFMRASLRLATAEDLAKYPRKGWAQIKLSLGFSHET